MSPGAPGSPAQDTPTDSPPTVSGERRAEHRLPYVLVAEADVSRAARCVDALRESRLGVLVARDGSEACQVLETIGLPELLVIDISLPGRDAFRVVQQVKTRDAHVPVLALAPCEEVRAALIRRSRDDGIGHVVAVTASTDELRDTIRALVPVALKDRPPLQRRPNLHGLVEDARRMAGAAGAAAYLRPGDGDALHAHVVWIGRADAAAYCEPRIFDWIRESGQPIVMPDLGGEPVVPNVDDRGDQPIRGLIAVPILGPAGQVVGVLCAFDVKPLSVDVDALNAFKLLGIQAGLLPELSAAVPS